MFKVDESIPEKVRILLAVNVFPVAIARVPVVELIVSPFTEVGVIAPSVRDIAGVDVFVATVPEIPLALVTETEVTVPLAPMFPLNLPIAAKIVSLALTAPVVLENPVRTFEVTAASVNDELGNALVASVPCAEVA